MTTFVDTSGLVAMLDADDDSHSKADQAWRELVEGDEELVTTNYVLLESFALIQHRLGMEAAAAFHQHVVPLLRVVWIDEAAHQTGVTAVLIAARRQLSLVDCTSFDAMHRHGIGRAFTLDPHYREQGFDVVPAPSRRSARP